MKTPIIDSSTLTEEQKEMIKAKYNELAKNQEESASTIKICFISGELTNLEWIFGKELFKKEG